MTADLIDFATFERRRLGGAAGGGAALEFPILVPGWPFGWLTPVVVTISISGLFKPLGGHQ